MSVEEWLLFGALRLDIGRRLKVRFGRGTVCQIQNMPDCFWLIENVVGTFLQ